MPMTIATIPIAIAFISCLVILALFTGQLINVLVVGQTISILRVPLQLEYGFLPHFCLLLGTQCVIEEFGGRYSSVEGVSILLHWSRQGIGQAHSSKQKEAE